MKTQPVKKNNKEGAAASFRPIRRKRKSHAAAFNPILLLTKSTDEESQAKLKVGSPDDKYEKEADSVAQKVVDNAPVGPVMEDTENGLNSKEDETQSKLQLEEDARKKKKKEKAGLLEHVIKP